MRLNCSFRFWTPLLLCLSFGLAAVAYDGEPQPMAATDRPKEFEGIGIEEKLGAQLNLDLMVTNELGEQVPLRTYFQKGKPVVLSLIYFGCPGLCNFHLNGVVETMREIKWSAGDEFELLALSFDPSEDTDLALNKKGTYVELYKREEAGKKGMHFLTASTEVIEEITQSTGFKYKWDDVSNEWAHASAAIFLSPEGKISRYLHGIMFDPPTFRLALNEASQGKVGSIVDQMIYYCFRYDPTKSKYTLYAFRLVQLGGILVILVLAGLMLPTWIRARREKVRRTSQ